MEQQQVKPLDLDHILGATRNRVSRVGVELEGAWLQIPPHARMEHDGSVFRGRNPVGYTVGEIPIGPVEPAAVGKLITLNYPHKVNHTCGMHVHMSFSTLWYYNLLMVPEYQETVIHYLAQWAKEEGTFKADHCIWSRLRGESEYCQRGFWPDVQAATKRKSHDRERIGHRYTVIHYCGRQMTVECRVLPMMAKAEQAIRAVDRVIDITNACLFLLGKTERRPKVSNTVELVSGATYEEWIEESL